MKLVTSSLHAATLSDQLPADCYFVITANKPYLIHIKFLLNRKVSASVQMWKEQQRKDSANIFCSFTVCTLILTPSVHLDSSINLL